MSTIARTFSSESAHWYTCDGQPCHEVKRSDGQGMRPTTLRDARKLGLLPSPTSILKTLHKEALVKWLEEQACLAVLTTPRLDGEELDAFVERVLHKEKQQDAESQKARDLGTDIHAGIELSLKGLPFDKKVAPYVNVAVSMAFHFGNPIAIEKIVVGDGYAGKTDLICEKYDSITVIDFKSCKKVPKQSYDEARLQLSAYAKALGNTGNKRIQTANIYIPTTVPCEPRSFVHDDWLDTFENGFKPLLHYWQWKNDYIPKPLEETADVPS